MPIRPLRPGNDGILTFGKDIVGVESWLYCVNEYIPTIQKSQFIRSIDDFCYQSDQFRPPL